MLRKKISLAQVNTAFWQLVRWPNLLLLIFTQYFTKISLIDQGQNWEQRLFDTQLFMLCSATVLIAAAGYIINDYYDIKIDLINKPKRVVIGRYIKRRWALGLHQCFSMMGIGLGFFLNKRVVFVNILVVTVLWLYANHFKRTAFWGNFIVSILTAASVVILAVFYGKHQTEVYIFGAFSFFISLLREIVKDMEDIRGDANFGCQTLPIVWGIRKTKRFVYLILFLFVNTLIISILYLPSLWPIGIVFVPLALFFYRLLPADTRLQFHQLSTLCKYIMLLGVLSMAFV